MSSVSYCTISSSVICCEALPADSSSSALSTVTITDEPLAQQTDEILNADDEDAHPSTDTVDSADEGESAGNASQQITDDETVQEDTLDMDTSQHTEEIVGLNTNVFNHDQLQVEIN
jgi:hypothetical protein